MPIRIEFIFDFNAYLQTQKLHLKNHRWQLILHRFQMVFFPLLGIFALISAMPMFRDGYWALLGVLELTLGAFLVAYPLYVRWRWKRCFTRTRVGNGATVISLDNDKICVASEPARSEVAWAGVSRCVQDDAYWLLYIAPLKFIPIPKASVAPEQTTAIQALIDAHVKTR